MADPDRLQRLVRSYHQLEAQGVSEAFEPHGRIVHVKWSEQFVEITYLVDADDGGYRPDTGPNDAR